MNTKIVIERAAIQTPGKLHTMEACPERLALTPGHYDELEVGNLELTILRSRHPVCPTCQHLEVASSADRVRFLLAGMAKRAS
jgi:hypothetical protein